METATLDTLARRAASTPARADAARSAPAGPAPGQRRRAARRRPRATQALGQVIAELEAAAARVEARTARGAGGFLPAGAAGQPAEGRDRRGHPRQPGGHRRGRDRLGQDHAAAEDLPGAWPRRHRPDRAYPAPADRGAHRGRADRRGARHRGRRGGRLQGAVHRQVQRRHLRQGDDRRHPAGRDAAGPAAAALRHPDHRRGPRAQPEHRLHPRLPQAAAARRPDLKVIITSATIDPERFSKHFGGAESGQHELPERESGKHPGQEARRMRR